MKRRHLSETLAMFLAVLMILPSLTACSETPDAEEAGQTVPSADEPGIAEEAVPEETEITRENVPDTLPSDLDYSGKTFT
ncbi:MAG: hypothetical protein J6I42_08520, partial [Clostridia bacterium]|nr:hypothetical protein [Clostridia bacterium]